jgi:hypothetical protein
MAATRYRWELKPTTLFEGKKAYFPSIRVQPRQSAEENYYGCMVINEGAAGSHNGLDGYEHLAAYIVDAVNEAPALAKFALLVETVLHECWSDSAATEIDRAVNETITIIRRRLGLVTP